MNDERSQSMRPRVAGERPFVARSEAPNKPLQMQATRSAKTAAPAQKPPACKACRLAQRPCLAQHKASYFTPKHHLCTV